MGRVGRCWSALAKTGTAPYQVLPQLPDKLLVALQAAVTATTEMLAESTAPLDPALQRFYFDSL